MNKKIIIFLIVTLLILVGFFLFWRSLKSSKELQTVLPVIPKITQTTPIYAANFVLQNSQTTIKTNETVPVTLKVKVEKDPGNKGITAIRAIIKAQPLGIFSLQSEDIQETLPKPWQYVRKEINKQGEITIEAIYLQAGETGDLNKEMTLALLNFTAQKAGKLTLRVDNKESKILTKENLDIPLTLDVYSNYEVYLK